MVMASDAVKNCPEAGVTQQDDEETSRLRQLEDVTDRLVTLSERMTLCNRLMTDLKALRTAVVRKSLQDVTLPLQK